MKIQAKPRIQSMYASRDGFAALSFVGVTRSLAFPSYQRPPH